MTSLNDIRATFLDYFKARNHKVVSSSSLIPHNDPTLMFVNSGMVQFKKLLVGKEIRNYKRAVTAQKCVRAGGKHNDLDNVGYTARHHTFFEMLGNFSFGDYFKKQAIAFAWDFITKELQIPKNKLYITTYHTDDEAAGFWKKYTGLPDNRIIPIITHDNFWMMGTTGPCGPCSEIFYDHGAHIAGGLPGSTEQDGDRFIEIWNLVFMQNEQFKDGTQSLLNMQSVDTGMGLERIGAVLQGSHDNYHTDVMRALIEASAHATSVEPYGNQNVHHRVIADHLRASCFLIADGVLPSNEARGYVLRRIMRRAMRHAHMLGSKEPIIYRLVSTLVRQMGQAYPELIRAQKVIEDTLELEEKHFKITLERGLKLLDNALLQLGNGQILSGEIAFKLYDTYGFPFDLTKDILRERKISVDSGGFHAAMQAQKNRARAMWPGSDQSGDNDIWFNITHTYGNSEFLGYKSKNASGHIIAIVRNNKLCPRAECDAAIEIALNQTPFYAESGGQVGDTGTITTDNGQMNVSDVYKKAGIFVHAGKVIKGFIAAGAVANLCVNGGRRKAICANHSATHLLHESLRRRLGDHVNQRGSLNDSQRIRFDFSHPKGLDKFELTAIEAEVNAYIRQNTVVETRVMALKVAQSLDAQALFGEKYADEVRVVSMGMRNNAAKGLGGGVYSLELCGGTHVARTGDIGLFIITNESASSAGVRRIEGLTGALALDYVRDKTNACDSIAGTLKIHPAYLLKQINKLLQEHKNLQLKIDSLRKKTALAIDGRSFTIKIINQIVFFSQILKNIAPKQLPSLIDEHKIRLNSGVIVLISQIASGAVVAVGVTKDLCKHVSAVDLVRLVVKELGGKGGGGRPDMAQGGAAHAKNAKNALAVIERFLQNVK